MTQNERRLIRSCISNGFEFHSHGGEIVKIGDEEISLEHLSELAMEIESALDKQIAMKPKFVKNTYAAYHCSVCDTTVGVWNLDHTAIIKETYCQHCGQAVDWNDKNEKEKRK